MPGQNVEKVTIRDTVVPTGNANNEPEKNRGIGYDKESIKKNKKEADRVISFYPLLFQNIGNP